MMVGVCAGGVAKSPFWLLIWTRGGLEGQVDIRYPFS